MPFIILSSAKEGEKLNQLFKSVKFKDKQTQFIPTAKGFHGSRALWRGQKGGDEYWTAIESFLTTFK